MKKLFILIPFLTFMMADAINVSPSTLNYGQVVMGDNPTLSFTVSAELEQTTITPPEFYSWMSMRDGCWSRAACECDFLPSISR